MPGLLGTRRGLIGDRTLRALLSSTCADSCCGTLGCRWIKLVWCCDPDRFFWLRMNELACSNYSPLLYTIPDDRRVTFSVDGNCYTTDPDHIVPSEADIPAGEQTAPAHLHPPADGSTIVGGCEDDRCNPCPECCGSVIAGWCGFPDPTCCECGSVYILDINVSYAGSSTIQPYDQCALALFPATFEHESSAWTIALRYLYRCDLVGGLPTRSIVQIQREITHTQSEGRVDGDLTCCDRGGILSMVQAAPNQIPTPGFDHQPPPEGCGYDPRGLPSILSGAISGDQIMQWKLAQPDQCAHEENFTDDCQPPNFNCLLGLPDYRRSTWNISRGCSGGTVTAAYEFRQGGNVLGQVTPRGGGNCSCNPACDVPTPISWLGLVTGSSTYTASWSTSIVEACNEPPCANQQLAVGVPPRAPARPRVAPARLSKNMVTAFSGRSLDSIALGG